MSLQSKQKFQRTSRSRKLSKDPSVDESLVKNSIMIEKSQQLLSSLKKSQQQISIDDRYQFVINSNKEVYQQSHAKNNISHLMNKLRSMVQIRVFKAFYKMRMLQTQKNLSIKTVPYMIYVIKSIEKKHLLHSFMKIKLYMYRSKRINTHLNSLSQLHKRKLNQHIIYALSRLKKNINTNKDKINKLVLLTKNEIQRENEFQKFQQSIQLNLKQKDYQLAKINIQNLIKKFNKQDKYLPKLSIYQSILDILSQIEKSTNVLKQSQGVFYKMTNFLDPLNVNLSITNNKQIKKQLALVRNRLQNNTRSKSRESNYSGSGTKDTGAENNTNNKKTPQPSFFESIQKVNDMIHSLFEQLAVKSTQKTSLQLQYETKIQALLKQQAEFNKKIQLYQDNQKVLLNISEKFKQTQNLSKQLTEINRRAGKRKNQFPHTFITQLITFTNQQKKPSIEFNAAIKSVALLYGRKNINQDTFNEQKAKIDEKYLANQIYTNSQTQINLLIKNVTQKQRYLIEGEMRKLRNQNEKLQRQLQTQKMKSSGVYSSSQSVNQRSSRKGSVTKSQQFDFMGMEGLKEKNQTLQKVIKEKQTKIRQLSEQKEAYQKATLQKDLVNQTLHNILSKIQSRNDTWRKDVQILRNSKQSKKYSLIFRVVDLIKIPVIEQNKQFNESFQTMVYNSKKQSSMGMKKVSEQLSDNMGNNNSDKNTLPLLGKKISSRENLSPQKQKQTVIINNHPRISQRISWDLSSRVNQLDSKATNSFILQDNLLDDQSDILGMKQSNLLDFDSNGDNNNLRNEEYQSKRLSFPLAQERRLLLARNANDNFNVNNSNNNTNSQPPQQQPIVSQQEMDHLNSILVKVMSQQYPLQQIRQKYLPQLLKNSYFANLVIMIESYISSIEKLNQLAKEKDQLQNVMRESAQCVVNERKLKQWISKCYEDMQMKDGQNGIVNDERYQQRKLENTNQPCILILQVSRLMKAHQKYLNLVNSRKIQVEKDTTRQQQQLQPSSNTQRQQEHQQLLIASLQRQLKQNQLKYRQHLQYYQRLQQQQYRSPQKLIQRTVKSSRSVKSIKSNPSSSAIQNTSNSNNNNKIQQIKAQYKQTIQQLSRQQKKLLQQIENLNIQKGNLLQIIEIKQVTIEQLRDRLKQMGNKHEQLQLLIESNKTMQKQVKQKYQQQFISLRQDLQKVKQQIYKQLQLKQHDVIYYRQAYQVLLKKYQQQRNIKQLQPLQQRQQQQYENNKNFIVYNNLNHQTNNNKNNNNSNYNNLYQHKQQINMQQQTLANQINQPLQTSPSPIKHVDQNTYLVTQHSIQHPGSTQTYRQITQIEQLKMHIRQLQQQRNHIIQSQVLKALKSQQEEFNNFYRENMIRMEEHFINEIIPQRIKQAQQIIVSNNNNNNNNNTQTTVITNLNQPQFLSQKYQQWKHTYLPVILQLGQKQWRQHYQQHQLHTIINKKYQQWQSIRLLSIMRQPQNQWIVKQLLKDKLTEINQQKQLKSIQIDNKNMSQQQINKRISQNNLYWQQQINRKIREVEDYWQSVALPAAINSQLNQWNRQQQILIKQKVKQVQLYYEQNVIPQRIKQYQVRLWEQQNKINEERMKIKEQHDLQLHKQLRINQQQWKTTTIPKLKLQWQQNYQHQHKLSFQNSTNIQQIINAKYQQWKQTYLKEYLQIQKHKWLEQFTRTELQNILSKRQSQWESIRLLGIVKEKRNQWVVEMLLKQRLLEIEGLLREECRVEYQHRLKQEYKLWQQQYARQHPIQQKTITKQVIVKQTENNNNNYQQLLNQQLTNQQQRLRLQNQQLIKLRIIQVEKYWQHIIQTERINFTQTLNKALQERTIEIERYWQGVMLPQIKSEWELIQMNKNNNNNTINEANKQSTISTYLSSHQFTTLLSTKHQQWLIQRQQQQLTKINELTTKYEQRIIQLQMQIQRLKMFEREMGKFREQIIGLKGVIDQREGYSMEMKEKLVEKQAVIKQLQIQILTSSSSIEQYKQTIQQLQHTISQHQQTITKLQQQLQQQQQLQLQPKQQHPSPVSIKQSSLSTKQAIYKLQTDFMRELNENKMFYQDRLAQVTHQKALLNIRIKELQAQIGKLRSNVVSRQQQQQYLNNTNTVYQQQSNTKSNKQTTTTTITTTNNLTTIQNNYQKQLLSLQATIKNKQAQLTFIKKSMQSLTIQNQQLSQRLALSNNKLSNIQNSYQQLSNKALKLQYEVKYLKQKQLQFNKKLQSQLIQFNQNRSRLQLQKSILQKKQKQLSTSTNQQSSILQMKINQLQSQKIISQSTIKNLQYDIQRKRKSYQQINSQLTTKQRVIQSFQTNQIQLKSTIKQFQSTVKHYETIMKQKQSVITQLKVENKHYVQEINRLNMHLQAVGNNVMGMDRNNTNSNNSSSNSRNNINKQQQYHNLNQHYNYQQHHYNNTQQLQSLIIQIQRLKLQNYRLKQKLLHLQSQQTTHIHHLKSHIQQLQQKLYNANLYHRQGEITEIQILKKINLQISQLVSNNKQLQLRIIVLENEKELSAFGISIERFFVAFQEQMDNLVNYLLANQLFYSQLTLSQYNKFQQKSREALSHGYVEDYFRQWQTFMRSIIEENIQKTKKSLQKEQTITSRQQSTSKHLDNKSQLQQQQQQEIDNIIEKYDTVLNDVKFTLTQFIKTGDSQLLSLMARSLGVDYQLTHEGQMIVNGQSNGKQEIYSANNNNQRTLIRQ